MNAETSGAAGGAGAPGDEGEITRDSLLRGRVQLLQPRRGFRSSLDPVLLAGFLAPPYGRLLDIGCGTGALAFLLLARDSQASGVGVEIQPRLARLAALGAEANGFSARLALVGGDVRVCSDPRLAPGSFDLVASNPPFQPLGTGELPPDQERRLAHHEVSLRLADWLGRAAALVRPGGRVAAVFPAVREGELREGLAAVGLRLVRRRAVCPRADRPPGRVLIEARRAGPATGAIDVCLEPDLVVHDGDGYSEEVRWMLGEADGDGR